MNHPRLEYNNKLEGTHRARTHGVLMLTITRLTVTLTFDRSTQNHAGYPNVIRYTKFEQSGIIRF